MKVYLVSKIQVLANILKLIDFYLSVEILESIITTLFLLSENFIESIYLSIFLINRLTDIFRPPGEKQNLWQNILKDFSRNKSWSTVLIKPWVKIWKTQQWPQDWKRSVFIPIPKKGNAKKCSNYGTTALISHASQVMLKIF